MTFNTSLGHQSKKITFKLNWLFDIMAVRQQRRKLAKLDKVALRDLGLTQSDVQAELKRPVWDVPANWRA